MCSLSRHLEVVNDVSFKFQRVSLTRNISRTWLHFVDYHDLLNISNLFYTCSIFKRSIVAPEYMHKSRILHRLFGDFVPRTTGRKISWESLHVLATEQAEQGFPRKLDIAQAWDEHIRIGKQKIHLLNYLVIIYIDICQSSNQSNCLLRSQRIGQPSLSCAPYSN